MNANNKAYQEGQDAYCETSDPVCPYPFNSDLYSDWHEGWNDAARSSAETVADGEIKHRCYFVFRRIYKRAKVLGGGYRSAYVCACGKRHRVMPHRPYGHSDIAKKPAGAA